MTSYPIAVSSFVVLSLTCLFSCFILDSYAVSFSAAIPPILRAALDDRSFVSRIVHEVVIRFIYKHGDVGGNTVEQQLYVVVRNDPAGGIIGVTEVDDADIAGVQFGHTNDSFNVGVICFGQSDPDGFRFVLGAVTVDGFVGGFDADDQFVLGQKRGVHVFQNFTRAHPSTIFSGLTW